MATLPDCMMPDGADPCAGYRELYERLKAFEQMRSALQALVDAGWRTQQDDENTPQQFEMARKALSAAKVRPQVPRE